jgi:glycogen operon protein
MGQQVSEFKGMLTPRPDRSDSDVVYNHTAEGITSGRRSVFVAWIRLAAVIARHLPLSGFHRTGNTFNLLHPRTLQLVMDSLRYWVNDACGRFPLTWHPLWRAKRG